MSLCRNITNTAKSSEVLWANDIDLTVIFEDAQKPQRTEA